LVPNPTSDPSGGRGGQTTTNGSPAPAVTARHRRAAHQSGPRRR